MNPRIRIASLLLLAACGAGTAGDAGTAPLELTSRLALDLPLGSSDSVLVGNLMDATRLNDGRLVLVDADRNRLVFVDSTGSVLGTSGRAGEGPGEFVLPIWIERCDSDSLFVVDLRRQLISVFDSVGRFARSFRPPLLLGAVMACSPGGLFVTSVVHAAGVPQPPSNQSVEPPLYYGDLVAFNSSGDTLQRIPNLPLGRIGFLRPQAAIGVIDTELIVGLSSSPLFHRYGPDGSMLGSDSFPLVARPVTDSLYDAAIDRMVAQLAGDSISNAPLRKMFAATPKPATAPLYQLLRVTPSGTEWLVTSLLTDPVTDVMGRLASGRFVKLTFPNQLEVYEIGTDYLLGKTSDSDGESHLMLYRWALPAN